MMKGYNMDGVVILNTFKETIYTWGWTIWRTIFLALTGFAALCGMVFSSWNYKAVKESQKCFRTKKPFSGLCILCLALCVLFGGITLYCVRCGTVKNVPTYQVLLEDRIKISKFREHYKIIEEQGITYIVQDR